jgi:guanylate kinase
VGSIPEPWTGHIRPGHRLAARVRGRRNRTLRGIAITGPTGVGKTTIQRRLVRDHGLWTPGVLTTRSVASHEIGVSHIDYPAFERAVPMGSIVFPHYFAGAWYGWTYDDLEQLRHGDGLAVVNVRPYTALVLSAGIFGLEPVWLFAEPYTLAERRRRRNEPRDVEESARIRQAADEEEERYAPLIRNHVLSTDTAVLELLRLIGARDD